MSTDELDERINRIADAAPPLTDETRARLSALLRPLTTAPATPVRRSVRPQPRGEAA